MLRAIREIRPRYVVGENVRGLTNWNGGLVFDEVQADLENEGYEVTPYLLPACAVNAPHRRDRIWFVAYRTEQPNEQRESEIGRIWNEPNAQCDVATDADKGQCQKRSNLNGDGANEAQVEAGLYNRAARLSKDGATANARQQLAGDWKQFPTQPPVCSRNDGLSAGLDGITFPKWREKSIGAYGNAIVPQVAHQIFKAIEAYEQ